MKKKLNQSSNFQSRLRMNRTIIYINVEKKIRLEKYTLFKHLVRIRLYPNAKSAKVSRKKHIINNDNDFSIFFFIFLPYLGQS